MISNMNLIFCQPDSYTALIGGNGGEDELVISISPGQDGLVVFSAIAMSVDGGAEKITPNGSIAGSRRGFALVRLEQLQYAIRNALIDWAHSGIKPRAAEREVILNTSWEITQKIVKTWGVHAAV